MSTDTTDGQDVDGMHRAQGGVEYDAHDIRLRDVRDGMLVVGYLAMAQHRSAKMIRSVSARLPVECLALFDGTGVLDVDALTAEERAWIRSESAHWGNEIDFEGVRT